MPEKRAVKNEGKKKAKSVKRTVSYGKIFFLSFAISFIIVGAIAILLFMNSLGVFGTGKADYDAAVKAIEQQDYDKAEELLLKYLEKADDDSDALLKLAEVYILQNEYDKAILHLEETIQNNYTNPEFYKLMVRAYVSKGDFPAAMTFIDKTSSYIKTTLNQVCPPIVEISPENGTYDVGTEVKISVPENCTVYYTLDGTTPSSLSPVYTDKSIIKLNIGNTTVKAVAINTENFISPEASAVYSAYKDNTPYEFADQKIESMIRAALKKATGTVYYKDLNNITELSTTQGTSTEAITTLADLQNCINLRQLSIYGQEDIPDFGALSTLQRLSSLTVNNCKLDTKDIEDITKIQSLRYLNLSSNRIKDISALKDLKNLSDLDLSDNALTDVAMLKNLVNLSSLDLSGNASLSDVSAISNLRAITVLKLNNTAITSVEALKNLQYLETLNISGTKVTSVSPIVFCQELSSLTLSSTSVSDYEALATLSKLKALTATNANITDLTQIASITSLETLNVSNNVITSVIPITTLPKLKTLKIGSTSVTDFEALIGCASLTYLDCTGCTLSAETLESLSAAGITVAN